MLSFSSLTSFEMERNAGWLESTAGNASAFLATLPTHKLHARTHQLEEDTLGRRDLAPGLPDALKG